MDNRLFEIILAIIPVIGTVITVFVVPLLKEKLGTERFENYQKWASIAVRAAEMIYKESGMGTSKKEFAVNFLNKMFNSKKTIVTEEQINALIEAAVKQMKIEEE